MNKSKLLESIKILVDEKISKLEELVASTRASNNDTKSSMGDKYETSREMLQQEVNRLLGQLSEAQKQKDQLTKITDVPCTRVMPGALVYTDMGIFYISESLGKLKSEEGENLMTISPLAPLSVAMSGKQAGESYNLNGKSFLINSIE